MRAQLRKQVAALFLLAPAAVTFTALPTAALAQAATPEVRGLEVTSDNGTFPGSRLRFILHGSRNAEAAVHIRGIEGRIPLREVEPGVYVGRYVVARGDRIAEGSPVRAILSRGNRTVTANYSLPQGLGNVAVAPPPLVVRPGPVVGEIRERGRGGYAGPVYAPVPIQIFSPGNNARVDGNFARVRGRTAPFASIQVAVQAMPGPNGASQRVWEQLVRADANGDFEFNFVAPSPVPGTRYDVSMTAHTPDATSEAHLVLYQV